MPHASFSRLSELPLAVERADLVPLAQPISGGSTRRTTVVRLHGRGQVGVGEDVNYEAREQLGFQARGVRLPLAGEWSVAGFSAHLDALELFEAPPRHAAARDYRRFAFESAALDLALRQAGRSLAEALGREVAPLSFVVSTRLDARRGAAALERLVARAPRLRFKLDATRDWDAALVDALARLDRVDVVDLKGAYVGTPVDAPPDAALYRRVAEGLPRAWIEDPGLDDATRAVLAPHWERVTWDAPIHSLADVDALERAPRCLNSKPSRFGTWRRFLDFHDACTARGIARYGGGQFELGPGRGQVQLLAALLHPAGPNDVAPAVYNRLELPPGPLPEPPLSLAAAPLGFRAGDDPAAPWNA